MTLILASPPTACGGIIVGLVVKHVGGVQKGFSILAGILLTGVVDYYVAGNPLSINKVVALPLVLGCTYLHITAPVSLCVLPHNLPWLIASL